MKRRFLYGGEAPKVLEIASDVLSTDENHVFYDVTIRNNTASPARAEYTESRTFPIVDNPSKYTLSPIAFFMPSIQIPLFYWPSYPFIITLRYGGTSYSQTLAYQNWTPVDTSGLQPIVSIYQFLDILNLASYNAFVALKAAHGGLIAGTVPPPRFAFDPASQLFELIADSTVFAPGNVDTGGVNTGVEIWMNDPLYQLFYTIPATIFSYTNAGGLDARLYVKNTGNNTWTIQNLQIDPLIPATPTNLVSMRSEVTPIDNWFDLVKIRVLATTLNISKHYVFNSNTGTNELEPVILEYSPLGGDTLRNTNSLLYRPSAEYERIDLQGTTPLKTFDCRVYWISKTGETYPVYISPYSFFSLRLMFLKKEIAS